MSIAKILINKITAVILILCTIALLVFFGAYAFAPAATADFLSDMPRWVAKILEALTFSGAETSLSIGGFFENIGIPSYSFDVAGVPVFNINLIVIIIFVALLVASNFFKPISLITTLAVDLVGGITALGIIEGYKHAAANDVSTWAAASSCFLPMFILLLVLLFSGCDQWIGVIAGIDERVHVSEYFVHLAVFLVIAALVAFVLSAIAWLLMGFGWSGFVFVVFFLICLASIIMEAITLFYVRY